MKKHKWFLLAVVFICCMALPVFAGGKQETVPDAVEKEEVKEGPVTLTVWDFKYAEEVTGAAFKKMDEMFMAENPGIKIDHIAQPETTYYEMLMATFTAETDVDVVLLHTDNRAWNMVDFYAVLDSYIQGSKDTYAPSARIACSASKNADSDIRMLPLTAQGLGMYYNKINFEKAGLDPEKAPVAWSDFLAACEALKNAGIPPIILGNQGKAFGIDFVYRVILATLYGQRIDGFADGSSNFTDQEFRTATRMIKTLYDKGYINVENGSIPYFMDAINEFKAGNGGFFCGLTSDIAHWKDFGDALGYENVGYFPSPVHPDAKFSDRQVNQGAGIAFAVVNYSDNVEEAAKYISFFTSGKAGKIFMDASGAIVPNNTIPVDESNKMLINILDKMNNNAAPDYLTRVPGGMVNDFYNYLSLYFIAEEISEGDFIQAVQKLYENTLD